jgi:hypothetical protein
MSSTQLTETPARYIKSTPPRPSSRAAVALYDRGLDGTCRRSAGIRPSRRIAFMLVMAAPSAFAALRIAQPICLGAEQGI